MDYTLTADPGVFTLTGVAVALHYNRKLIAAAGAFILNPPQPTYGVVLSRFRPVQLLYKGAAGGYFVTINGSHVSVFIDNIEGTAAQHHVSQGWSITSTATVSGLNSGKNDSTGTLFQDACAAVIAIVGDRGSQCPGVDVPTYLEEFIPEILSGDVCKIRIVYKGYPLPTYEFDGALCQVETNLDASGAAITTQYHYPDDYILDPNKAGKTITQGGLVSRPTSEPSFTAHFIVIAGSLGFQTINGVTTAFPGVYTATDVMTWLSNFEGCVNDSIYTIGLIVGQPREWMVTKVRGISKDGGNSYEASMTLQIRRGTWDQLVTFINPDDGKPPADLVKDTGYKQPHVPYAANLPSFYTGVN